MSAVAPSLGDDQPVVGEPASHHHQGVVVVEHPENQAPVVGEPAFSNGLQDQRPVLPSSADLTSANGVQSPQHPPLHEDTSVSASHVTASPPASTVDENPNLQQAPVTTAASNPGSRGGSIHEGETPITGNSIASSDVETADTPNASASVEEAQGADLTEDTVITHIDDEPHLPRSGIPSENPFGALEEGEASEESKADSASHVSVPPVEGSPNEQQAPVTTAASNSGIREGVINEREIPISENPTVSSDVEPANSHATAAAASVEEGQGGDLTKDAEVTHVDDEPYIPRAEIPTDNPFGALEDSEPSEESKTDTSMTQEEISLKGQADKHQQVAQSTVEEKQSTEKFIPSHTEADNGSVEGNQAITEDNDPDVKNARVNQNDSHVDRAISTGTVQENKVENIDANDRSVDNKELQHNLNEAVPEPEDSSVKSSNQKGVDDVPLNPDLNNGKESSAEAHLMDSSAISPGTRGIAVEECSNQTPANVDNPHHLDGDGDSAFEKEQDLPRDNSVDANTESEKSTFGGIKLPLIFTGLAIAVVGVAVAAFRRSR